MHWIAQKRNSVAFAYFGMNFLMLTAEAQDGFNSANRPQSGAVTPTLVNGPLVPVPIPKEKLPLTNTPTSPACPAPPEEKEPDPGVITPAMSAEGAKHPELEVKYERNNYCVADDHNCKQKSAEIGGSELSDELENERSLVEGQQFVSNEQAKKFYGKVSNEKLDEDHGRAGLASVSQTGFVRSLPATVEMFRLEGNKNFHKNDAAAKGALSLSLLHERREQQKLVDIFSEMRNTFAARRDEESVNNTDLFLKIAQSREQTLGALTCQLDAMVKFDLDAQEKLKSLNADNKDLMGEKVRQSEITLSQDPRNDPNLSDARAPASNTTDGYHWKEDDLRSFGPEVKQKPGQAQGDKQWQGSWDLDLFKRVHQKHREKERAGVFQKGILD